MRQSNGAFKQPEASVAGAAISRRCFVGIAAGMVAAGTAMVPRGLAAADDGVVGVIKNAAATTKLRVQPLRGNVSVVVGSGGNVAVLPGPDGKLLVDAGIAVSQAHVTEALAGISGDPVRHLVNTHWHFDHTDGNAWLHAAGAGIIAHANTRKRLLVRHRVPGWRFTFPAAPAGALPAVTFKKDLVLHLNGATVALDHCAPAHTDSDISAHFTEADVLHVADTFWNGAYPFIDYSSGGSIDGAIEAAEANVARVTDRTIVIPGHGPVGNKADLVAFRDMLVAIRENVARLKEAGRSLSDAVAAKPTADFDETWGKFVITPDAFTELVYPRDWTLQGSADGSAWTVIDTVVGEQSLYAVNLPRAYLVDAPGAYSSYRLAITDNNRGTGQDATQIGDVVLYETAVPEPAATGGLILFGALPWLLGRRRRWPGRAK